VPLPPVPGLGGRNQHFALYCARAVRGQPIAVLSAGTDGIDGNSPAAGAVVDGTTCARSRALGLSVHDTLQRFDAHPFFAALGDTVTTGSTGTNVRDLRLLVAGS
jgi:hydroxypyruvate reductase